MEEALSPKKRIQLFFDGTSNSAARGRWADATNIFRLVLATHYEGNQIVHYMPGVGTRRDVFSAVTARGMDEILREAYVTLAANYLPGDEIYVFGFSRGGATALALAEIISQVGLLHADRLHELHVVWDVYLGHRGRQKLTEAQVQELRNNHIHNHIHESETTKINFLGLFDPVPGNSWDTLTRFSAVRLNSPKLPECVVAALSLLAIDDNRNPSFRPVVLSGKSRDEQYLDQVWMPGVHADVGGCSDFIFLSDVALLTMINQVKRYCPNLVWDTNAIDSLNQRLGDRVQVAISDERPGLLRKLLISSKRRIGLTDASISFEQQHPIVERLMGKMIHVRFCRRPYKPDNLPLGLRTFDIEQAHLSLLDFGLQRALAHTNGDTSLSEASLPDTVSG
ncbi:DUF2235 domain-containing protein [Mesorhizobium muleiense]|uniref:T6SS phospholipase effector Tle1-like catalytic domain-containing protein n=1 Tax=Mesorhizobium muleiense TaxID=1004279 RepID=UPI001F363CE0|nr:DUF2235 domain-containing protein [Mesorhizobium muleiense]MCF6117117.1 DUF2235 domain-containing protein [Mesorhizobium muleiense]